MLHFVRTLCWIACSALLLASLGISAVHAAPTPTASPAPSPSPTPEPPPCPEGMTPLSGSFGTICVQREEITPAEVPPDGAQVKYKACMKIGDSFVCFPAYYVCRNGKCFFLVLPPVVGTIKCTYNPGPPPSITCTWGNTEIKCSIKVEGTQLCTSCSNGYSFCMDYSTNPLIPDLVPLFPGVIPGLEPTATPGAGITPCVPRQSSRAY